MLTPDLINGLFEFGGSILLALNVKRLTRDKKLQGVHWLPTMFFSVWGLWNLFYYPYLGQWLSLLGGIAIVSVNLVWLTLLAYYTWRSNERT